MEFNDRRSVGDGVSTPMQVRIEDLEHTYKVDPRTSFGDWGRYESGENTPERAHQRMVSLIPHRGIHPISVAAGSSPGLLSIHDGHHRVAAAKDLGMSHIPAYWHDDADEEEMKTYPPRSK